MLFISARCPQLCYNLIWLSVVEICWSILLTRPVKIKTDTLLENVGPNDCLKKIRHDVIISELRIGGCAGESHSDNMAVKLIKFVKGSQPSKKISVVIAQW